MISIAGNCLLILAIFSSILAILIPSVALGNKLYSNDLENWNVKQDASERSVHQVREHASPSPFCGANFSNHLSIIQTYSFFFSCICLITAFILLVIAFITSDFSLRNVFLNSSTIKPLIYKIAGSWASHEGSFLLYTTLLSFVSCAYIKLANYQQKTKLIQISVLSFIQILFLFFIYLTSNPFDSFKFSPNQGLGLNPMLQDEAISIHPPLLYLGYVGYIATYVNAILLLFRPQEAKEILNNNMLFTNFALMTLTSGIGLGAWWAYRELGWGGYWFFDPVENISLMPWLAGISLHHFLLINKKSGKLISWTIFTSFLPFLLTLYGIFFVRSGIISSVHNFAFSKERGLYLFSICSILTGLSIITFIVKNNSFKRGIDFLTNSNIRNSDDTKDYLYNYKTIVVGNILWLLALLSLFIALVYPVYYSFFYQNNVAIDPAYFHQIFIPIFIPLMLLAAFIPCFKINIKIFHNFIYGVVALGVLLILSKNAENIGTINAAIIFASIFLIVQMLGFTINKTNYFRQTLSLHSASFILGHLSLGLLAFAISTNVIFSKDIEFIGKVRDSVTKDNFIVKLDNIKFSNGQNYYRQIAEFSVQDSKGNIAILKPENRLYKIENSLSQETDIFSYLSHDIVATLNKINGENIHAVILYRPMISLIWLSVFLIAIAFLFYTTSLIVKNYTKKR